MKNLSEPATVNEIKTRLDKLTPQNQRQWGKMSSAQAIAHCAGGMEWVVKDSFPPRIFIGSIVGGFIKPKVLQDDEPMRRNSPTVRSILISDERDLVAEKVRLSILIDRFVASDKRTAPGIPTPSSAG
jgi:hypothetical protein